MLDRLRPHPVRGDTIAAGAVPLSVAAFAIEIRMTQWSHGARFVVVGLIAVLILTMAWLAPLEGESPRAYHSILLVAGLLPLALALNLLSSWLGAHGGGGAFAWTFALEAGIAALSARRANSAVCTLIAALAAAIAVEAFVSFVFHPHGSGTFRSFLVLLTLVFAGGAVRLRDSGRRHAVQLVNAAGVVALVLALTLVITGLVGLLFTRLGSDFRGLGTVASSPFEIPGLTVSFGWKLYILAMGLGLVAYAAADREPGPAYLGAVNLLAFAVLVGLLPVGRHSLVGWPLFLLVLGGAGLAVGLRPMQPLPPEPPTRPLPPDPIAAEPPTRPMTPPEEPSE